LNEQEQIFRQELQSLLEDIEVRYDQLGMRAGGQFASDLEIGQNRLSGEIWGSHYVEQLVNGRPPGKMPPVAAIEQWIDDKGIAAIDITSSSLAFLIARKIAREGTEYFKQGGTDLIDSVVTPERIQSIIDKVTVFYVDFFVQSVTNQLRKIAA
jgi:hypothetical protein